MVVQLPEIKLELPCPDSLLPTKAELVQFYNDIAMIPSKLKAYLASNPDSDEELKLKIEETIKKIEEFMEQQEVLLSPWWQGGTVRNWQKEANDAWSELIDEFHIYVPVKMLELIGEVIPLNLTVSVMGIEVDLLTILEKDEQERLKLEITEKVDLYYTMIPEEYQYYKGEFGVECDEWKGKLTWSYFKNELVKWCTNLLLSAFEELIDVFKEIWDTLGLPSPPTLLEFDVETWIRAQIDQFKQEAEDFAKDIEDKLTQLKEDLDSLSGDSQGDNGNFIKEEIAKLEKEFAEFSVEGYIIEQLREVSLFGVPLLDIIGGEIETNVECPEDQINELVRAARDWFAQWQKELINVWIKKIESFLSAIGLGSVMEPLTLTFCDVLELIGVPMTIDLSLPDLTV